MRTRKFVVLIIALLVMLACNHLTSPVSSPDSSILLTSTAQLLDHTTSAQTPSPVLSSTAMKLYFTFKNNANCRFGPSINYAILTIMSTGKTVEVLGRNEDSTWFLIKSGELNSTCWVSIRTGKLSNSPGLVSILTSAVTPTLHSTKLRVPNQLTSTIPPFPATSTPIKP